jgi:hypothetical protein
MVITFTRATGKSLGNKNGNIFRFVAIIKLHYLNVRFESRYGQEFSLLHVVQTDSGAHPASYSMSTGGSFPGRKAAGACS